MDKDVNKLGRLSQTEMEIIRTIWGLTAPVTVQQVLNILAESRKWKTSTLSTLLSRLIKKGFLTKEMKGNINLYTPTLSEDEFKKHETRMFMSTIHNGSYKSFIAALVNDVRMDSDELAELREWFQEKIGDK